MIDIKEEVCYDSCNYYDILLINALNKCVYTCTCISLQLHCRFPACRVMLLPIVK